MIFFLDAIKVGGKSSVLPRMTVYSTPASSGFLFVNTELEEDSVVYGFEILAIRAGAIVLTV